jgi:ATP synthase protein I
MPQPDDRPEEEALGRLSEALQAFEAGRARSTSSEVSRIGEGYRLLAELIGGVLGGVGFGWLFDRVAHTAPWGLAIGVSLGAGVSVFMAARTAARMGRSAIGNAPPQAAPPDDDED